MGFVKNKSLSVLSVSDWTLQSIPGVNSSIYCVDQNPTPYSAPLLMGSHSPNKTIPSAPNMLGLHQIETFWVTGTVLKEIVLKRTGQPFQSRSWWTKMVKRPERGRSG